MNKGVGMNRFLEIFLEDRSFLQRLLYTSAETAHKNEPHTRLFLLLYLMSHDYHKTLESHDSQH